MEDDDIYGWTVLGALGTPLESGFGSPEQAQAWVDRLELVNYEIVYAHGRDDYEDFGESEGA